MKRTFTRYVIQREDGKFYWHGNFSSYFGYADNLDEATLYRKEFRARVVAKRESNVAKVEVKEVKVTIEIE